jgi:hypothetical protein
MTLSTEDAGDISDVTGPDIDRVLSDDDFGSFAILFASESDFIQAGNDWQPGEACRQFQEQHDSDPWVLEYRDGAAGKQFRAAGPVPLDRVRGAFRSYLSGTADWRTGFDWHELDL